MINENNVSIIIFFVVFNILSYFAGHKDGQNDDYVLGIMFLSIVVFMGLGACEYRSYLGFGK